MKSDPQGAMLVAKGVTNLPEGPGECPAGGGEGCVSPDSPVYPKAAHAWTTVAVLTFFYVLSLLDRNILSLLIDPIKRDLGISDFQISLLYGAAFSVFYALGALPIGCAVDRYGRRGILAAGVICWSIATSASGLSRSFAALFAARAAVGVGESVIVPAGQSMIADSFPPHRMSLPMSIYGAGTKLGAGISLLVGGLLVKLIDPNAVFDLPVLGMVQGWQVIFLAVGLPGVVFAGLLFFVREPQRRPAPAAGTAPARSYADYFRFFRANWRFMAGLHLGQMLVIGAASSVSTWSVPVLSRVHGWSLGNAGLLMGLILIVGPLAFVPLHGILVDRAYGAGKGNAHLRYLSATALLAAPFALTAFHMSEAVPALALVTVSMVAISGFIGIGNTALALAVPSTLLGKSASVQLLLVMVAGYSLGSSGPAMISDFIFRDPARIGTAVSIYAGLSLLIAAAAYRFGSPVAKTA